MQMKMVVLIFFIGTLGFLPVYILDSVVMPQLLSLKQSYENFDTVQETVQKGNDLRVEDFGFKLSQSEIR